VRIFRAFLFVVLFSVAFVAAQQQPPQQSRPPAQQEEEEGPPRERMSAQTFAGLRLRSLGPALTSGRVVALAVNPRNRAHYFVGAASGGVWKTTNAGTTFTPVFDAQGSYSIGALAMDPKNANVVWVGTGENNSQRSVSYGDGVYKTEDGGRTWRKMGLEKSEHIAKILIDPRDANVVYVAAQGPLWGPGGDRGLYKTTDGGKTWRKVLEISENTGVTDLAMDPEEPDVLYAAAWQRRRHYWTLINGGPESALYKSTDAGANWTRLRGGLPNVELGRIGLAISPVDRNVIYATVEAADRRGGIFVSTDRGMNWERRNSFDQTAMYYGKIFADPKDRERIYVMNVQIMVSDDGGRNLRPLNSRSKHVDNHVLWIDPADPHYYLVGCDGGLYESFDRGDNWQFKANLPVTQFYQITVDNAAPFYSVYGGTQDNYTLGGPARTRNNHGISNADWFVVVGGDGFHVRVDPDDPNTVYGESQYGGLVRFDRRTGERVGIQPSVGKGESPLRWNWDSPLIISPHSRTRLYFGANRLFRSDDRGDSWRAVSPDLTRQIDRNKLPVMGKVWGVDAVAKHASTAFYGNISALAESPLSEGLIYVGTDDGLIQITTDGGRNWQKYEKIPGVPENALVSRILPSQHDAHTVYAAFNNHQNADFAPYLLKSTDAGKTWVSLKGDLPANGPVWAIAEDHVNPDLLFVGTEFALYFTLDGGKRWIRLRGGMPTIAVRDLAIQKRENDLAVGTFGRGIYILDNYAPLREVTAELLNKEAVLFAVKDALLYIQAQPIGGGRRGFQGESFFVADNPPFGATFTYYLRDALRTRRQRRQQAERAAERRGETPRYPTPEELRAEEQEEEPAIILTVKDAAGNVVRRLTGPTAAGMHRVAWDLRLPPPSIPQQAQQQPPGEAPFGPPGGPLAMPGKYQVTLAKRVEGKTTEMAGPVPFQVVVEGTARMPAEDRAALFDFQQKLARLQRAVQGALETANSLRTRLGLIKRALQETPAAGENLREQANAIEAQLNDILIALRGDTALRSRNENTPPSISERVNDIVGSQRMATQRPTQTARDDYKIAAEEFAAVLPKLRQLIEVQLAKLEKAMEAAGAPHTPGRIPDWKDQ